METFIAGFLLLNEIDRQISKEKSFKDLKISIEKNSHGAFTSAILYGGKTRAVFNLI